jgi:hypothetical protein
MSFALNKAFKIDYQTQSFACDFISVTEWVNPALVGVDGQEAARRCGEWKPKISLRNCIRTTLVSSEFKLVDIKTGRVRLTQHQRSHFAELIELHQYPYDHHQLSVIFRSEHPSNEVSLLQNPKMENVVEGFGLPEWALVGNIFSNTFEVSSAVSNSTRHSEILFTLAVRRNPNYYELNHLFVCFILGVLSWGAFFFQTYEFASRSNILYLLILSAIAFRYVLASASPQVPYITLLDKFYFGLIVFLFAMIVESSIVSAIDLDVAKTMDQTCRYLLPCCWIIYHWIFRFYGRTILFTAKHQEESYGGAKTNLAQNVANDVRAKSVVIQTPAKSAVSKGPR